MIFALYQKNHGFDYFVMVQARMLKKSECIDVKNARLEKFSKNIFDLHHRTVVAWIWRQSSETIRETKFKDLN